MDPKPLNRVSFEDGGIFSHGKSKQQFYTTLKEQHLHLYNANTKLFYAIISEISDLGFTAKRSFFDEVISKRINFKNCTHYPFEEEK